MLQYSFSLLRLPLAYTWKLSRNASVEKVNAIVSISDGRFEGRGEAAPNVRYGESPELMQAQFERWEKNAPALLSQVSDIDSVLNGSELCNALRFALESAFMHYLAAKEGKALWELLSLEKPGSRKSSYSLPVMEISELARFYEEHQLQRFELLKLKTSRENPAALVKELYSIASRPLIIDANEAFQNVEEVLAFCREIEAVEVEILEQPMPSSLIAEYLKLKEKSPFPVFGDESLNRGADIGALSRQFHGLNVKLMKTGGYLEALRQLKEAREYALKTMIGCMVETTLGISSALQLESLADYIDLDGFMILREEPFGLLKESNGILSFA